MSDSILDKKEGIVLVRSLSLLIIDANVSRDGFILAVSLLYVFENWLLLLAEFDQLLCLSNVLLFLLILFWNV